MTQSVRRYVSLCLRTLLVVLAFFVITSGAVSIGGQWGGVSGRYVGGLVASLVVGIITGRVIARVDWLRTAILTAVMALICYNAIGSIGK